MFYRKMAIYELKLELIAFIERVFKNTTIVATRRVNVHLSYDKVYGDGHQCEKGSTQLKVVAPKITHRVFSIHFAHRIIHWQCLRRFGVALIFTLFVGRLHIEC